ncbi:hypothetical protein MHY85_14010 [Cellulomonas sp. ACRRI]|uniref:hypothetical protein n=1 Tax=Cellulomonas sp. ACRRI TaxID=2918188 RepID=UPI001EF217AE|nr:hypothetical protein [Cellulomonas sp. ACRRI]MCG7287084.1 hypothetical protein [Cellulomonas sp. ACRRI]
MRAKWWAVVLSSTVLGAALLGACGPTAEGDTRGAAGSAASTATPPPAPGSPADEAADDAAACTAFGDVLTIIANADLGLAEGRMAAQEQHGWYELATRVLDRLPSDAGTPVQTAIGALQAAAPAVPSEAFAESTGVRAPAWSAAEADLAAACEEVGSPLAIQAFTGG